jgi:MFS family permease
MSEKKRSPLGVLFLTLFIDLVGFSIIFPLFPAMLDYYLALEPEGGALTNLVDWLRSLSGDTETNALTVVLFGGILGSLYSLLQFLFAPVWGGLSDRIGRKPVLLISISGTAISYIVWFFSGSFMLLLAARFLGGCASGNIATASAAVADSTTAKNRAKGMGIIGAAFGLGFILGPAIGAGMSTFNLLDSSPDLESLGVNPFSTPALVAFILSAINLLWVATRFQETLSDENRGLATHARRPINPLVLFRKIDIAGVSRANLVYFVYIAAFSGIEFTLTFFATDRFGYTHENLWVIFVYVGFIIALVQGGVVRRLAPRMGEKKVSTFGLLLLIPAFLIICFSPPSKGLLFLGLGLMAVGSALATPCLTALVSMYTPEDRQGSVLGVFRSLGALGRAVGPIAFCVIYWKFGSTASYASAAALLLGPWILVVGLPTPEKRN